MNVKAELAYAHNDIFTIVTSPSQKTLIIDKKEEGRNPEGPNSLEMFLASMAGCLGVYAKRYLRRHAIAFSRLTVSVSAELSRDLPMRLAGIRAVVHTDADLGDKKQVFERFIKNCPVHNTLLHTKEMKITVQ